jgi:hypothetical protein
MQNLWYTLTHQWNFARVVRLLIGLLILWQSEQETKTIQYEEIK